MKEFYIDESQMTLTVDGVAKQIMIVCGVSAHGCDGGHDLGSCKDFGGVWK